MPEGWWGGFYAGIVVGLATSGYVFVGIILHLYKDYIEEKTKRQELLKQVFGGGSND